MGVGMTPEVIAAATNMINNLNPMAVLQVSRTMTVVITLFDENDDKDEGITHDDHNLVLLLVIMIKVEMQCWLSFVVSR